jgi:hypothetical protein
MTDIKRPSNPSGSRDGFDAARIAREEDHLDRWPFAQEIYGIAVSGRRDWSVRIGVYGEWGSGKTSVLRFAEAMAERDGHLVVRFNPWQFQSSEDLWKNFVDAVFKHIKKATGETAPGELRRQGKKLAATAATALPAVVRLWNSEAGNIVEKGLGLARKALAFSDEDLKSLAAVLAERRLIVTIDDLDRTDARLVPEVLFALKEIMDVPGMSFICAFDPTVVGEVLGARHPGFGDGLKFLDKIVDFPRWLPGPTVEALGKLALADATTHCPFVPQSQLMEAVALLPKNPRAIRQFIRLLGLLRLQIERHHPHEIHWSILLASNVLKVRFPKHAQLVLGDSEFWNDLYTAYSFLDDAKEERNAKIAEKLKAVHSTASLQRDEPPPPELNQICEMICERLGAWHGVSAEILLYQFRIAENPDAVTWKEFDEFLGTVDFARDEPLKVQPWIVCQSEKTGRPEQQVYSELLTAAIRHRNTLLGSAADAISDRSMNSCLREAEKMLHLIARLIERQEESSTGPYYVAPVHLEQLVEQLRLNFGWRRTPKYRAARRQERELLTKLFRFDFPGLDPWLEIIGTYDWESRDDGDRPEWAALIGKFRNELRKRSCRWFIEQVPKTEELVRKVLRDEGQGHRYRALLFDRTSPLWTTYRRGLIRSFCPNASNEVLQNNAYDLLSWLNYTKGKGGTEGEEAKALLSETDFALQLWRACVAAPLNPRAVGTLREVPAFLKSLGVTCTVPAWWDRIVSGLPKR